MLNGLKWHLTELLAIVKMSFEAYDHYMAYAQKNGKLGPSCKVPSGL